MDLEISNPNYNSEHPIPYGAEEHLSLFVTNLGSDDLEEGHEIRYNSEAGFSMVLPGGLLVNETKPLYYVTIDNLYEVDTAISFCAWIVSDLHTTQEEYKYLDTNQSNDSICINISFEGANSVKVSELNQISFKVYPNPTRAGTSLFIQHNNASQTDKRLSIIDITGRTFYETTLSKNRELEEIVLPKSMQQGMYFLIIRDADGKQVYQQNLLVQ
ncbi:MAG TPA: T9SS type A sorting domain-containing protein [Chitinophagaceae bacterium]|nr:T9SS type A sorting domain-containing protein [Chitinophagaceae bacterium]